MYRYNGMTIMMRRDPQLDREVVYEWAAQYSTSSSTGCDGNLVRSRRSEGRWRLWPETAVINLRWEVISCRQLRVPPPTTRSSLHPTLPRTAVHVCYLATSPAPPTTTPNTQYHDTHDLPFSTAGYNSLPVWYWHHVAAAMENSRKYMIV